MLDRRAVLAASFGALTGRLAMATTSEQHEAARLREAFAADPEAALRGGFAFSWWCHGGEPGPDWLSDKLDLVARDGQFSGVYTRARPDPAPPFQVRAQSFSGGVPEPLIRSLLAAIFERRLFEATLPSELRGNVMDALQQSFDLTLAGTHLQKTLFEPAPEELGSYPDACARITQRLMETGSRRELPPATRP